MLALHFSVPIYNISGSTSNSFIRKLNILSNSICIFVILLISSFCQVLVLGREKEGIPVDIIHILDACIEIPQLGVVRSLNVHVSGAIALWEYTRQQRSQ